MLPTRSTLLLLYVAGAAASISPSFSALLSLRGGAKPVQLVTGQGEFVSSAAASIAQEAASGTDLSVVASLGGRARGRQLLNALFDTEFSTTRTIGTAREDEAGAWVSVAPNAPNVVLLDTEPTDGSEVDGPRRTAADSGKLAGLSFGLADAIVVHSPVAHPTQKVLQDWFERLFVNYLAVHGEPPAAKALIVHVADASAGITCSAAAAKAACAAGWAAAAATSSSFRNVPFSDCFEFEHLDLPHPKFEKGEYETAVTGLRAKLMVLGAGGLSKQLKASALQDSSAAAWDAAGAALDGKPVESWLQDRYWAARAFETAYALGSKELQQWSGTVANGGIVKDFGAAASAMLNKSLDAFDAGVADCSAASDAMLSQRRSRLQKSLVGELQELFSKQHRSLTMLTINRYKAKLLQVVSRSGFPQQWQQDSLRRSAEKQFDEVLSTLIVDELGGPERNQLNSAFSKQLTEQATKFIESPPMQLQAMHAMRRRTGKGQKPPRGVRVGLGLVGAVHSKSGGGQGNLQSFAGYTSGLNSAHFMFANDGLIPDSTGSEPPLFRWQPKMNFDVSI